MYIVPFPNDHFPFQDTLIDDCGLNDFICISESSSYLNLLKLFVNQINKMEHTLERQKMSTLNFGEPRQMIIKISNFTCASLKDSLERMENRLHFLRCLCFFKKLLSSRNLASDFVAHISADEQPDMETKIGAECIVIRMT